jgi:hypothetical protein
VPQAQPGAEYRHDHLPSALMLTPPQHPMRANLFKEVTALASVLRSLKVTSRQYSTQMRLSGFSRSSQHQALDALNVAILHKKVNYVLDADIRSFFDTIDHGRLMKFSEHRIADRRILRLVRNG